MGLFGKKTQEELNAAMLKAAGKHKFVRVKELMAEGAQLYARDQEGNSILHYVASYCPIKWENGWDKKLHETLDDENKIAAFLTFLKNAGFDMNTRNRLQQNALFSVVGVRQKRGAAGISMYRLLRDQAVDVDARDIDGKTLLHVAALYNQRPLIESRLMGMLTIPDNSGKFAHDYAIAGGHKVYGVDLQNSLYVQQAELERRKQQEIERKAEEERRKAAEKAEAERIASLPPEQKPVAPVVQPKPVVLDEKWVLSEPHEVTRIVVKKSIDQKIKESFNFQARSYTRVVYDIEAKIGTMVCQSFDDYADKTMFKAAHEQLIKCGGTADKESIYQSPMDKKPLKPAA